MHPTLPPTPRHAIHGSSMKSRRVGSVGGTMGVFFCCAAHIPHLSLYRMIDRNKLIYCCWQCVMHPTLPPAPRHAIHGSSMKSRRVSSVGGTMGVFFLDLLLGSVLVRGAASDVWYHHIPLWLL